MTHGHFESPVLGSAMAMVGHGGSARRVKTQDSEEPEPEVEGGGRSVDHAGVVGGF